MLATLHQASVFTKMVKGASSIAQDLLIITSSEGPLFQVIDLANVCLVQITVFAAALSQYMTEREHSLVVSLPFLKSCSRSIDDDMTLTLQSTPDTLFIEGLAPFRAAQFETRALVADERHEYIPLNCDRERLLGSATMESGTLIHQLVNLSHMGDDIQFEISKDAVRLSLRDAEVASSVSFGSHVATIDSKKPAKVVVSSHVVKKMISLLELGPAVTVHIQDEMPLEFEVRVPSLLHARIFVAPKVA